MRRFFRSPISRAASRFRARKAPPRNAAQASAGCSKRRCAAASLSSKSYTGRRMRVPCFRSFREYSFFAALPCRVPLPRPSKAPPRKAAQASDGCSKRRCATASLSQKAAPGRRMRVPCFRSFREYPFFAAPSRAPRPASMRPSKAPPRKAAQASDNCSKRQCAAASLSQKAAPGRRMRVPNSRSFHEYPFFAAPAAPRPASAPGQSAAKSCAGI